MEDIGREMESAISLYWKIRKLEDNKEYTLVKNKGFIIITRRTNETRRNNTSDSYINYWYLS